MQRKSLSVSFVSALGFLICCPLVIVARNYTGHALVKVTLNRLREWDPNFNDNLLNGTLSLPNEYEVLWTGSDAEEEFAMVRVPPEKVSRVKRDLSSRFIVKNLQNWIDNGFLITSQSQEDTQAHYSSLVTNFRLDRYQPLSEVYRYLKEVSRAENVKLFDIGSSHEGRKIQALEIMGNPSDSRVTWIDACTHAREWVTVTTAIYVIEQALLTRAKVNFVIVPVINPDGYEYTWTTDRLWRKNRRPYTEGVMDMASDQCLGVDLNRNYDVKFGGKGTSGNPCSHLFRGPSPLSEPETQSVANMLWTIKSQLKLFLSLHSFNQLWASPYAFTKEVTPHHELHMRVLRGIQQAVMNTNGVAYKIGPLSTSLYVGSGFALDWVYVNARVVHSYLAELRDEGQFGFLLPRDQIIPTATETWEGIKAAINQVYNL